MTLFRIEFCFLDIAASAFALSETSTNICINYFSSDTKYLKEGGHSVYYALPFYALLLRGFPVKQNYGFDLLV